MRSVGVDLGTVRIGIAISDSEGRIATPYEVLARAKTAADDHRKIAALAQELGAEVVVVGLPLSLDGSENAACKKARQEAAGIARALNELPQTDSPQPTHSTAVRVVLHDERFTTTEAERSLSQQKLSGPQRRRVVDKVAATVLLQAWLDGQKEILS